MSNFAAGFALGIATGIGAGLAVARNKGPLTEEEKKKLKTLTAVGAVAFLFGVAAWVIY